MYKTLRAIRELDELINKKLEQYEAIKSSVYNIVTKPKEDSVQTTPDMDKIGTAVTKALDIKAEIDDLIDKLHGHKMYAHNFIKMLPTENEKEVIYMRYFDKKSFSEIADELGIKYQSAKNIHHKAIRNLEKMNIPQDIV